MKRSFRTLGALTLGIAVTAAVAVPAQAENTTPSMAELEHVLFAPAEQPEEAEDRGVVEPAPSLDLPEATPQSHTSSFFICIDDSGGFFCSGGCPAGTRCATEACGSTFGACCTFQTSCVTSCQVSPGCSAICRSCNDF